MIIPPRKSEGLFPRITTLLQSQADVKKGRSHQPEVTSLKSQKFPRASLRGRARRTKHERELILKVKSRILPQCPEPHSGGARETEAPITAVVC